MLPPAGWYTDPYGAEQLRWWDGEVWTEREWPTAVVVPRREPTALETWAQKRRTPIAFALALVALAVLVVDPENSLVIFFGVLANLLADEESRSRRWLGLLVFAVILASTWASNGPLAAGVLAATVALAIVGLKAFGSTFELRPGLLWAFLGSVCVGYVVMIAFLVGL